MWGVHAVSQMVESTPACVELIYAVASARRAAVADVIARSRRSGLDVRECTEAHLDALTKGGRHQGVAARIGAFAYADFNGIVRARPQLIVALDCVQDPRNLGAILRTAEAVAAGGIVLPKDRAAGITPAVVRSAAGHVHRVPIAQVTNLTRSIETLKGLGWWAVGLFPDGGEDLYEAVLPERTLLIIGGEGGGMRPLVARSCDKQISVPMAQGVDSLNAAVAAGVALYEIQRRWRCARVDARHNQDLR